MQQKGEQTQMQDDTRYRRNMAQSSVIGHNASMFVSSGGFSTDGQPFKPFDSLKQTLVYK